MTGSLRGAFAAYTGPQKKPVIDSMLLREMSDVAVIENQACARKVSLAASIWNSCIHQTIQVGEHITDAGNYAASETAAVLGCSKTVADTLAEIGMDLRLRLPSIRAAFEAGELDLARVRAIYRSTCWLSAPAAERVEAEVLAASRRLSPGPLATEINAIIQRTAPEESAENRKAQGQRTGVRYRDKDVLATIEAQLESADAAACWQLITEMAATLCPRDPRTRGQRHAAAYIALMHRETYLSCTCEIDEDHPCTGKRELPGRRVPLTTVTIDLETLAGLTDLPAYLAGHGLIDADYARDLIATGDLQLLLTEAIDLADKLGVRVSPAESDADSDDLDTNAENNSETDVIDTEVKPGTHDDSAETKDTRTDGPVSTDRTGTGTDKPATDGQADSGGHNAESPSPTAETPKPGAHLTFHPLGRGRRRGGMRFPKRPAAQQPETASASAPSQAGGKYRGSYTLIAALEKAIAANPALAVALYPDGHGGHVDPPDGALRYRPGAAVADCVRQRDRTCRHPGCDVAAAGCEIDHVVPYSHRNPRSGGWTVLTNLHCLCRYHHSLKTMGAWTPTMLAGAVNYWTSSSGTTAITLPGSTVGTGDLAAESLLPHIPRKRRTSETDDETDTQDTEDEPADVDGAHTPVTVSIAGIDWKTKRKAKVELGIAMGTSIGLVAGIGYAMNRVDAGDWAPF